MTKSLFQIPEQFRIQRGRYLSNPGDRFGAFFIPMRAGVGRCLFCIADAGDGTLWEHVSVSVDPTQVGWRTQVPSYLEMSFVKNLFWLPEACVVEFHPPAADHINLHPGVLHLWRYVGDGGFPMPPKFLV